MLNFKFILCFTLLLIILLISETNGCMVSIAGVFLLGKSVTSSFFQKFWYPLYSQKQNSAELKIQGVPKRIIFKLIFEFLSMRGVFLGVKNNSKKFGN